MDEKKDRPGTKCVHGGAACASTGAGLVEPIHTSTAHRFPNEQGEIYYPRLSNTPTQKAVSEKMRALEGGGAGLVLSSGMSAISTVLFALLREGDHGVFQSGLYGGTQQLVGELSSHGIESTVIHSNDPRELTAALKDNSVLLFMESPTNPLLDVVDLREAARLAGEKGALTVVDNTFATPINQRPLELGIDVVVHSGTKYLNGHSDVTCGAIVTTEELMERFRARSQMQGGTLDGLPCYLLDRGLKTLELRITRQNANAMEMARFLLDHPGVRRVYYPGLPGHPGHEVAAGQMEGYGGMLSFEPDRPDDQVEEFFGRFDLITPGVSLGGVETLVCAPAQTSHSWISEAEREKQGIRPSLVRMSVGIEDIRDLTDDMAHALAAFK